LFNVRGRHMFQPVNSFIDRQGIYPSRIASGSLPL
jgi:hypothetical protein